MPDADPPSWAAISVEIQPGDISERDQGAIVGREAPKSPLEIDEVDGVSRITVAVSVEDGGQVDHGSAAAAPKRLACLVRRDRDEPGADLGRVSQASDPPPCDRPCRLDGIARGRWIPNDDEGHAGHRRMVFGNQDREGRLVALGGPSDDRLDPCRVAHGHVRHVR